MLFNFTLLIPKFVILFTQLIVKEESNRAFLRYSKATLQALLAFLATFREGRVCVFVIAV
jgi:uncharacterized membrane protein